MIGTTHAPVTVATILKMNNTAIRRGYNRAIDWDDCGDTYALLRDRLALFRPCMIDIAVPAHGANDAGELHHRCCVMLPVEEGAYVAAHLDVNDADYRAAIASDISRMLELELPPFANDPMELGIPRTKLAMLDECFALLDEYDALGDIRE